MKEKNEKNALKRFDEWLRTAPKRFTKFVLKNGTNWIIPLAFLLFASQILGGIFTCDCENGEDGTVCPDKEELLALAKNATHEVKEIINDDLPEASEFIDDCLYRCDSMFSTEANEMACAKLCFSKVQVVKDE